MECKTKPFYFVIACAICLFLSLQSIRIIVNNAAGYFCPETSHFYGFKIYESDEAYRKTFKYNEAHRHMSREEAKELKKQAIRKEKAGRIMSEVPQLVVLLAVFLLHMMMWCRCSRKQCDQ